MKTPKLENIKKQLELLMLKLEHIKQQQELKDMKTAQQIKYLQLKASIKVKKTTKDNTK